MLPSLLAKEIVQSLQAYITTGFETQTPHFTGLSLSARFPNAEPRFLATAGCFPFILESSVGRGGVCACGGTGQGATTRNSPLLQG
ncbi:MAG: hypothetical protein GY807_02090 [Gammaproteobacteria bacterium]|nr:hypothetical protein [Gammaproteobacteria bacterium]